MPPALPVSDDEDYASSEDSDFIDDAGGQNISADSSADSDSEAEETSKEGPTNRGEGATKKSTKRKRANVEEDAQDAGFENSGDEAIIEKGLKRQRRKGKKGQDEDEGGEGGLIKTRSMRAQEYVRLCSMWQDVH